jgi:hypothetical protein
MTPLLYCAVRRQVTVALLALLAACLLAPMAQAQHAGHKMKAALGTGAAASPDGRLWVVSVDEGPNLFIQVSADDGNTWSARQVLDTEGDKIAANGEASPKIAFGLQGQVVVSYTRPLPKSFAGDIRLLRSTDGGTHFSAPVTVNTDRQEITHRFDTVGFDAQGRLHVAWLDRRDAMAAGAPYQGFAVYHATSVDAGEHFETDGRAGDAKLADHSCECCRMAMAPTANGGMALMWRHQFESGARDHAFVDLGQAKARRFVRASFDEWKVNACPDHGPGLALASDGGFHAVWFGMRDGVTAVRYGRLDATGTPTGAVRALPDERAEHASVIARGAHVVIAWRSFDGQAMRLRAWNTLDDGKTFSLVDLARTEGESDHPRLVQRGDDVLVVWRTQERIQVIKVAH